jgi:ElaB/YqjD/DUF883 family membrane-anchored ribosome-binding protein
MGLGPAAAALADAESRLEMHRETLCQRLERENNDTLARIARMAGPLARQTVREHPYTSLAAAALAGVWLVRRKPWRALGGSVLGGLLAHRALSLSLSSGSRWLSRWSATDEKSGTHRQA